ncbi:hypothetical protein ElyMa_006858300 [Elysia marginata]|uniref:Uncharacterized protein n=1 Tax=Elysia marginata TaxID=1093978 RepID=A0AAV4J8X9_9GAST|nr:hypothetical protein ElyMa_006858300 [Elysia marginata]
MWRSHNLNVARFLLIYLGDKVIAGALAIPFLLTLPSFHPSLVSVAEPTTRLSGPAAGRRPIRAVDAFISPNMGSSGYTGDGKQKNLLGGVEERKMRSVGRQGLCLSCPKSYRNARMLRGIDKKPDIPTENRIWGVGHQVPYNKFKSRRGQATRKLLLPECFMTKKMLNVDLPLSDRLCPTKRAPERRRRLDKSLKKLKHKRSSDPVTFRHLHTILTSVDQHRPQLRANSRLSNVKENAKTLDKILSVDLDNSVLHGKFSAAKIRAFNESKTFTERAEEPDSPTRGSQLRSRKPRASNSVNSSSLEESANFVASPVKASPTPLGSGKATPPKASTRKTPPITYLPIETLAVLRTSFWPSPAATLFTCILYSHTLHQVWFIYMLLASQTGCIAMVTVDRVKVRSFCFSALKFMTKNKTYSI